MTVKTAVMICGHGSRDDNAVEEFNRLSGHLSKKLPDFDVESGFLEFATPVIRTGLDKLGERGAERIVCLPGMLFAAGHVKNDLPSEINAFSADNPDIEVLFGRDLGIDAKLLEAARDRIQAAEDGAPSKIERARTLLMVVGRGTNDPDANSNVSKVARMLGEGMGFGRADVSFSGVASPLVDAGLAEAVKLDYGRIIVFPYFLFTGILVGRIYRWTDEAAAANPDVEIIKASYLSDHERVIESFVERVHEALAGGDNNNMNCQLCKYRERVIGYEDDRGAPQVGHHHHVRGIGTDGADAHDHGHHHHSHDHGHNPGDDDEDPA